MTVARTRENIMVLGGTGLLGTTLIPVLVAGGHEVAVHGRRDGADARENMADEDAAARLLSSVNPSVILNLVALTDVDRCEEAPQEAFLANTRVVENIVRWVRRSANGCYLVHMSTDHVYDGQGPHGEKDVTLTNYYAFSKYAGELVARRIPSSILRTNFFGRGRHSRRTSFTDWLHRALSNQEPIQVFDDVLFSPLSMAALSAMIELLVRNKPDGVLNVGSREGMSKADFAFAFAEALGLSTGRVKRTTTAQVSFLKTYRPKDMRMNCSEFETVMGVRLPDLADEIKRTTEEYRENT